MHLFERGNSMGFISRIFKKRKTKPLEVILKTNKELSKEQIDTIITIVRNGMMSGVELSNIAIEIMISTGIYAPIFLQRMKSGVEVIF